MSRRSRHHRQPAARRVAPALALALAGTTIALSPLRGVAEVTFDRSVGPPGLPPMTLSGAMNIPDSDGTQLGPNLFHSFSVFDIDPGESATFTSSFAGQTDNVIARVTGNSASVFQGPLINTIGTSALWIFNPNGVAFSSTSSISLNGALHVSDADYLLLNDGNRFGADLGNPDNTMLSMAPPVTFGFLGTPGSGLSVSGTNLQVDPGATVSLIGDGVTISNSDVIAPGGRVNVASISSGEATLGPSGITLSAGALPAGIDIDASTLNSDGIGATNNSGGGSIYIRGGQFTVHTGSSLSAETNGSVDGETIDIDVGSLTLSDSAISTDTNDSGGIVKGDGGSIRIANAQTVSLSNSRISSSATPNGGDAGLLTITGVGTLTLDNSTIEAATELGGAGGSIDITSDSVLLDNESTISVSSSINTSAPAGTITIDAGSRIDVMDSCTAGMNDCSGITASSGGGLAGGIVITTPEMNVSGRVEAVTGFSGQGTSLFTIDADVLTVSGTISTRTDGVANAGSMQIVSQDMTVDGGQITSSTTNEGLGGNITIDTGNLTVTNGGELLSSTDGSGDAGTIGIDAGGAIAVTAGGRIASDANDSGSFVKGNGGAVLISNAQTVMLDNGEISSNANPNGGDAGELRFENVGAMTLTNSSAITASTTLGGRGGSIVIAPVNTLSLSNNSEISVSSSVNTSAQAGTIDITATGSIDIADGTSRIEASSGGGLAGGVIIDTPALSVMGTIEAVTQFSGQGTDNFRIDADTLTVGNGGRISTSTSGVANAGSMEIVATDLLTIDGGEISSSTSNEGLGGTITITAGDVVVQSAGLISSASQTSASGAAGGVIVSTRDLTLTGGSRIIATTASNIPAMTPAFVDVNATGNVVIDGAAITGGAFDTDANGDIIRSGISVSTSRASDAGTITVDAANLTITRGGEISASTRGAGAAGEVIATVVSETGLSQTLEDATGQVIVSRIESSSRTSASGPAGDVTVTTGNLGLFDGAQIAASTESDMTMNSDASITVAAAGDITIDGAAVDSAGVFVRDSMAQGEDILRSGIVATTDGASDAGGITVTAANLTMTGGGEISASTRGAGNAGAVVSTVAGLTSVSGNVTDAVDIVIVSRIESASRTSSSGRAGSISLSTANLELSDGGRIAATTESDTPAIPPASITLNVSGDVSATGAVRDAAGTIRENESGDQLRSGIIASTRGISAAGDITIAVTGDVGFSDLSVIESASRTGDSGPAGNIGITAGSITLTGGAGVVASTESDTETNMPASITATADTISLAGVAFAPDGTFATDTFGELERSSINVVTRGNSQAGSITLSANDLTVSDGASVSASTLGGGAAGAIDIDATAAIGVIGALRDVTGAAAASRIESASRTSTSGAAGSITVDTGSLELLAGGQIAATTASDMDMNTAATITVNASGDLTSVGAVLDAAGQVLLDGNGDAQRSGIVASTRGRSDAGAITLDVGGAMTLDERSYVESASRTSDSGSAGSITIDAADIAILDGAGIVASTESDNENNTPAEIMLTADSLSMDGVARDANGNLIDTTFDFERSTITAVTAGNSDAGGITIMTASGIDLTGGADISASTSSGGDAGAIDLLAPAGLAVSGGALGSGGTLVVSRIDSASRTTSSGAPGDITLRTASLSLADGGQIAASTQSDRTANRAASIRIVDAESISITGTSDAIGFSLANARRNQGGDFRSGLSVATDGASDAGDISLGTGASLVIADGGAIVASSTDAGAGGSITGSLEAVTLRTGGQIVASTAGSGNGGSIDLVALGPFTIVGAVGDAFRTGLETSSTSTAPDSGVGGSIDLRAGDLLLDGGARISATSLGGGNAGTISVVADKTLGIFAGSSIETKSDLSAGGNIAVGAGEQLYMIDSSITASAFGVTATDNGGNVAIERPFFFILNRSDILAQANAGNGGNIDIAGDFVFQSADSVIDASSNAGLDGVITIDSPNDVTGTVIDLQIPLVDVSGLLRQRCLPDELRDRSSFVDEGRGGVRRAPGEYSNAPVATYIEALSPTARPGAGREVTLTIPVAHLRCRAPRPES